MQKAHEKEVDILCFPESHLSGYRAGIIAPETPVDSDGLKRSIDIIAEACRTFSMGVIMGMETPNSSGKPFNSAYVFDRDGAILAVHHKAKLTALDSIAYNCGEGPTSFTFDSIPMGLVICYEGFRFPEHTRALGRSGAKIVFQPTCTTTLPKLEWKVPVLESLVVARAAETTMYYAVANISGKYSNCRSMVIDPDGLIKASAELGKEALVVADIRPELATHAFLEDDKEKVFKATGEYDALAVRPDAEKSTR